MDVDDEMRLDSYAEAKTASGGARRVDRDRVARWDSVLRNTAGGLFAANILQ